MSDDEDMAAFAARLEEKAAFHAREAERYKVAADVVRTESRQSRSAAPVSRRAPTGGDPRFSTMSMIETVLDSADGPVTLAVLTEAMVEQGWKTESANPSNTVRTAATRLMDRGLVARTPDGRYVRPGRVTSADPSPPQTPAQVRDGIVHAFLGGGNEGD